jgi:heme A synthase
MSTAIFYQALNLPFAIIYLVGIVFSLLAMRKFPLHATLSLVGFILMFITLGIGISTYFLNYNTPREMFTIIYLVKAGLDLIANVLILLALFLPRNPPDYAGKPGM